MERSSNVRPRPRPKAPVVAYLLELLAPGRATPLESKSSEVTIDFKVLISITIRNSTGVICLAFRTYLKVATIDNSHTPKFIQ